MKRFRILSIILAAVLMLSAGVQAVEWDRYAMEGGVVNDIAFVTESGSEMVLCVCQASGLFYKNWVSGSWETNWHEELPAKLCYGVDAVYYDGDILALCSTEGKGVWHGTYDGGWDIWEKYPYDITLDLNYYPNAEHYPGHYEDAAFCCINGVYDFDHVFCTLDDYEEEITSNDNRSGIYYWSAGDIKWLICSETLHLNFSHFYRDKEDPEILYAVGAAGIYMFDGDEYSTGDWGDITTEFIDPIDYQMEDIMGFYQESSSPFTKYILAKVIDLQYQTTEYIVFNEQTTQIGDELEGETDDPVEDPLYSGVYKDLIVKCYQGTPPTYEIWVGSHSYGPLKYDSINGWQQLQGSGDTDLTTWSVRCMVEDPVPTGTNIEIFYGTWQGGIFYSEDGGDSWLEDNDELTGGSCGASIGGGFYDTNSETLYGCTYQSGLFEYNEGPPAGWDAIGEGDPNELASYCKSFNFLMEGPGNYLFATARPYLKYEYGSNNRIYLSGGLYKLDLSNDELSIADDWDDDVNHDDRNWDGCKLAYGNSSIYVSTGEIGYGSLTYQNKQIISRGYVLGTLTWENIKEYTSSDELGILALHPYNQADKVIYGLGNRWNFLQGIGSVEGEIYGPDPSNPNTELNINNNLTDIYSVFDIDVSFGTGNDYTVYAATANWSPPGSALGMYQDGKLMKYVVTSGNIDEYEFDLNMTNSNPGVMSVRLFDLANWHLVFCLTKGYAGTGTDMKTEIHLLGWQTSSPNNPPHDFGLLEIDDSGTSENLQTPENIIEIYEYTGGIHFLVGGGSDIFEYVRPIHTDELYEGVNWYSVNYYFPFDNIAFILSNLENLEVAVDQWGYRYIPGTVDSIYIWDPLECYKIRVSDDDAFEAFYENKIPTDTNIVLIDDDTLNWNYIAYLPDDSIRCDTVFADVGNFVMVKNDDGGFWGNEGGAPFYMRPGEGYQVKVSVRDTLNYPASQGEESINPLPFGNKKYSQGKTNSLLPTHFVFTDKTGDFYPIIIDQIMVNGENPAYGDEIGIFTPEDICVGAVKYEGEFPLNFPAWKDDPWTAETDGYLPSQQMVFKFWDASSEVEVPLTLLLFIPENIEIKEGNKGLSSLPSAEFFEENDCFRGSLEGNYILPLEFSLSQNYPNPFNPATTIKYTIKWRSKVKISIFNLLGQEVIKLVDDLQDTGQYRIVWDGKNKAGAEISSGIYFLKMSAKSMEEHFGKDESFNKSLKMLMLK